MPLIASLAIYGIFAGANISTAAYTMLTTANARLITTFGTPAQIEQFAEARDRGPLVLGRCACPNHEQVQAWAISAPEP
jgi:hypothetical protein